MPDYTTYTAEELAQDDFFRLWVYQPDAQTVEFWSAFLARHPETQPTVLAAKTFLQAIAQVQIRPTQQEGEQMWEAIEKRIQSTSRPLYPIAPDHRQPGFGWRWLAAAASIVLVLGLGYWFVRKPSPTPSADGGSLLNREPGAALSEKINDSDKPLTVSLSDGSQITLQPTSRITYPNTFSPEKRTVQLVGEGFFDIAKKPEQPFMVYANGLVVQVVGTSFTVKAPRDGSKVQVMVRTGKVAVFSEKALRSVRTKQGRIAGMLLLSPNQQVLFDKTSDQLTRSLVAEPVLLTPLDGNQKFEFENAPLSQIVKTLEEAYGVTIKYNPDIFGNCYLTAPLGNDSLFQKLDIICQTIGATYEVWGTDIIINGKGCR